MPVGCVPVEDVECLPLTHEGVFASPEQRARDHGLVACWAVVRIREFLHAVAQLHDDRACVCGREVAAM